MVAARRQDSARERVVRSRRVALLAAIPVALVALILFVFVLTPASDNDNGSPALIGAHGRSSAHGGSASDREASSRDERIRNMREKGNLKAIKMVAGGESGTSGGGGEAGGDTYAVVVDAVSAESSSVHVYRFDSRMELAEFQKGSEMVHSVKPGLGAYGDNATAAANSLRPLMKKALKAVPEFMRPVTPVLVRATGGQEQLSRDQAGKILAEIRQMLTEYPFPFSHGDVSTLGDTDAGFFAWTAVNHLLGNLGKLQEKHLKIHLEPTVAVVELGNTSAHVAYAVPADVADKLPAGNVRMLRDSGSTHHVYVRSMQGYGLMAGRALVLRAANDTQGHPCMGSHGTSKQSSDTTPASLHAALCSKATLHALQQGAAAGAASTTTSTTASSFSAQDSPHAHTHAASADASLDPMLGSPTHVCPPGRACLLPTALDGLLGGPRRGGRGGEGAVRQLVVTSALFDTAHQFGLIPHSNSTAVATAETTAAPITAQHFARIAEETCGIPLQEATRKFPLMNGQDAPYACLDASYLFHLLTSGLGLEPTDPLTPVSQLPHNAPSTNSAWHYGAAVSTAKHAHAYAVF
ncbi:unnamed protein product [Closterium sp. NIES-64]|nr:unnamed protein product [Closterium sp. NIES-64]